MIKNFVEWFNKKLKRKKKKKGEEFQPGYSAIAQQQVMVDVAPNRFGGVARHWAGVPEPNFLYDFLKYSQEYSRVHNEMINIGSLGVLQSSSAENREVPEKLKKKKLEIQPKAALEELETVPTPFKLVALDDKLKLIEKKIKLLEKTHHPSKEEMQALKLRIENRKRYPEFKQFFEKWQNTTEEKIAKLLDKYDLVKRSADLFVPEMPADAIEAMLAYTEQVEKLCEKVPVFYVIAPSKMFKSLDKKRDPILLVQSPFGFYWQILGAWDEEMLLLGEL